MAKTKAKNQRARLEESLEQLAERIGESQLTRQGQIIFHLSGAENDLCLDCGTSKAKVSEVVAGRMPSQPLIEVSGDASVIQSILEGEKDPVKQFVAGNLRVRGDLRYLSDLALELELIESPL